MDNKRIYLLATFTIKDKSWANKYLAERKRIYFTADSTRETLDFIRDKSLDANGAYEVDLKPCRKEDLNGHYPTDGFYCVVRPDENDVIGKMDISRREFLVNWELRGGDGEYAPIVREVNFIVTDTDYKSAGERANEYAIRNRYAYRDDCTHYYVTDAEEELRRVKTCEKYVVV